MADDYKTKYPTAGYLLNNNQNPSSQKKKKKPQKKEPVTTMTAKNPSWASTMLDSLTSKGQYAPPKVKGESNVTASTPSSSGSSSGTYSSSSSSGSSGVGGPASSGSGMRYSGFGKPPGYNRKEARRLVNADIRSQIRELLMQAREQKGAMEYDVSKLDALLGRQTGDLNYIFNEAKDYMGAQSQKINAGFNNARTQSNELFNQFAQQNNVQTEARRQQAMAEMQRLGIQQAGMGQFDSDAQNLAGQANLNNANANANLGTMQAGADTVGNLLGSMAEGSRTSNLGRAQNQHGQSVADARQMYAQYRQGIQGDIRNTRKNRFSMVNDLMQKLQEQRFNQWMGLNQANFSNQLDTNQFNLGMGQFNAGNFWKQADLTQQAAESAAKVKYNQQLLDQQKGAESPWSLSNLFGLRS